MLTTGDFLELIDEEIKKNQKETIRFGKIDASYTSGRPQVVFEGTDTLSIKKYPYLEGYTPTANDKVILIKNVIFGKIV